MDRARLFYCTSGVLALDTGAPGQQLQILPQRGRGGLAFEHLPDGRPHCFVGRHGARFAGQDFDDMQAEAAADQARQHSCRTAPAVRTAANWAG
jgi:hypothetical protein